MHIWHLWHELNAESAKNATSAKCKINTKKMKDHRYILEPYKGTRTRYHCPCCQKSKKTFSRYIDRVTGDHIHPSVGRCDREDSCGYHYTPKKYFQDNDISFDTTVPFKTCMPRPVVRQSKPGSSISVDVFKQSLQLEKSVVEAAEINNFLKYLIHTFGVKEADRLRKMYCIGTSKCLNSATVFWQQDVQGVIRTGKIIRYNSTTGKRVKNGSIPVYWVHKALNISEFNLIQCLFGEHLLVDKTKPVAIVESEKTAVIASAYLPQYIWLAVGGVNNLNSKTCMVLKGRSVFLFPDLNCYEKWVKKAKELSFIANFEVCNLLERKATADDRIEGLDIADYLLRYNVNDFQYNKSKAC